MLRELGRRGRHRRRRDPARSPSTACPARRRASAQLVAGGRHGRGRPAARPAVRARGRGVRGARARGRGLGFPTANVAPEAELRPKLGIYAARARVLDGPLAGTRAPAALSVGTNPTFAGAGDAVSVEAYLLDFDGDLYDRRAAPRGRRAPARRATLRVDRRADRADSGRRRARPAAIVLTDVRHRDDGRAVRQAGPDRRSRSRSTAASPRRRRTRTSAACTRRASARWPTRPTSRRT